MRKLSKYDYIFTAICSIVLFLFLFKMCHSTHTDSQSLVKNKVFSYGRILNIEDIPRGSGLYIYFEFEVNDSLYKDRETIFIKNDKINLLNTILIDKSLPIVYDSTNIENNEMLFSQEAFNTYGLIRHDSLNYIYVKLDSLRYGDK